MWYNSYDVVIIPLAFYIQADGGNHFASMPKTAFTLIYSDGGFSFMNTNQLKDIAVSYALANGLLHGEIIEGKQYYTHMPISLFHFVVTNFVNIIH